MSTSLLSVAATCPWLLVWLVAGVLAAARWSRHPVVSALVVTAAVLHVLGSVAQAMVPMVLVQRGMTMENVGFISAGVGLVGLVGSCCLIAAVFTGRQDPRVQ